MTERVTGGEVVARLFARAAARPEGVVAFDADGTIWAGDVGEDYFHYFLERAPLLEPAARAVEAHAEAHGIARGADAHATLRAVWDAYRHDRFPEDVVCEMVAWCAAGRSRADVEALARAAVAPDLASRLRPELAPVLDWVRAHPEVEAWVVSASPRFVVDAALEALGDRLPLSRARVVGIEPLWSGDVMLPEVARPISYAQGKVSCLRAHVGPARPLLGAFGDSGFDAALLSTADVPVGVRPKPRLVEAGVPGLLVLREPDFR